MRLISLACGVALALATGPALAQKPAPAPKYSIAKTTLSTLMDDPAAKAVVIKYLPQMAGYNSTRLAMNGGMTLLEIYKTNRDNYGGSAAPTDEVLNQLDAELGKLPGK